jgi:hypothetical protein
MEERAGYDCQALSSLRVLQLGVEADMIAIAQSC